MMDRPGGVKGAGEGIAFAGLCIGSAWMEISGADTGALWALVALWAVFSDWGVKKSD